MVLDLGARNTRETERVRETKKSEILKDTMESEQFKVFIVAIIYLHSQRAILLRTANNVVAEKIGQCAIILHWNILNSETGYSVQCALKQ